MYNPIQNAFYYTVCNLLLKYLSLIDNTLTFNYQIIRQYYEMYINCETQHNQMHFMS